MGSFVRQPSGAPCWQSLRSLREGDLAERLGPCSASLFFFLWSPRLLSQLYPWSPCTLWKTNKWWGLTFWQIHGTVSVFLTFRTWYSWVLKVVEMREWGHHVAETSTLEKTTLKEGKIPWFKWVWMELKKKKRWCMVQSAKWKKEERTVSRAVLTIIFIYYIYLFLFKF